MNNRDDNQVRFDKLYELLGDEVNSVFEDKTDNKDIFTDNNTQVFSSTNEEDKNEPTNNALFNSGVLPQRILNETNTETVHDELANEVTELEKRISGNSEENRVQVPHEVSIKEEKLFVEEKPIPSDTYSKSDVFRNKNIILKDDFDDGLDAEEIRSLRDLLANKKFLKYTLILAFIFVCIVVGKAFYFGDKLDEYEDYYTVIEKKEEEVAKIYEGSKIDNEVLKKVAANELITCINSKVDMDNLSNEIKGVINEINGYYNQSNNYFAFLYKDIYTGFTVSYNANQNIFTASTIKGPTDIYIYEMASQGKVDLDEELTYTGYYVNNGSGVLKTKPINTKYSVRTLLGYSTIYSDNAAHNMLEDHFGRTNMLKFWQDKGTTAIFTANNNWGVTNAHDASIYMSELYNFYVENNEYGEALMNNFMNATPKFIVGKNHYVVANKSGWSGTAIHDVSIVFADNPYIVVGLSNLGDTDYYMSYFSRVNDLAYKLHTEYWKYKMNQCNNIKQY